MQVFKKFIVLLLATVGLIFVLLDIKTIIESGHEFIAFLVFVTVTLCYRKIWRWSFSRFYEWLGRTAWERNQAVKGHVKTDIYGMPYESKSIPSIKVEDTLPPPVASKPNQIHVILSQK